MDFREPLEDISQKKPYQDALHLCCRAQEHRACFVRLLCSCLSCRFSSSFVSLSLEWPFRLWLWFHHQQCLPRVCCHSGQTACVVSFQAPIDIALWVPLNSLSLSRLEQIHSQFQTDFQTYLLCSLAKYGLTWGNHVLQLGSYSSASLCSSPQMLVPYRSHSCQQYFLTICVWGLQKCPIF